MKRFFLLVLLIPFTLLTTTRTLAQMEASPDSEATTDAKIKDKVEQRIQKVLSNQINEKKAFVGQITTIADSIIITTQQGEKEINFDDQTIFVDSQRKEIEVKDLEEETYVIAMGIPAGDDALDAIRVVITEKPIFPEKVVVLGTVNDISSDGENILMIKQLKDDQIYEVEVTDKTKINQKENGNLQSIKFNGIETDNQVIAIGVPDNDNDTLLSANLIRIQTADKSQPTDPGNFPD